MKHKKHKYILFLAALAIMAWTIGMVFIVFSHGDPRVVSHGAACLIVAISWAVCSTVEATFIHKLQEIISETRTAKASPHQPHALYGHQNS